MNGTTKRRWAFRAGRLFGIDVHIHVTFFLLLLWLGTAAYASSGLVAAVHHVVLVSALFGCVVLHELGHALTARRFGIPTRDITLYPIGGVARLERMPEDPTQELLVALAGPAVNMVLALLFFAVLGFRLPLPELGEGELLQMSFLGQLMWLNVILGIFNLFPAFPMDGGRVLRALLVYRFEYSKATEIAARIGQFGALVLGFVGLLINPFLVLIAIFVWFGAGQEASMVRVRSLLHGLPARSAMATQFRVVYPLMQLGEVAQMLLDGSQQDFPVMEGEDVVGMLTRKGLVAGIEEHGSEGRVAQVMDKDFLTAHPADLLESLFVKLQTASCTTVPVFDVGERLVGIITADNVFELLMVREAVAHASQIEAAQGGHRRVH